jgi:hypothetical protein
VKRLGIIVRMAIMTKTTEKSTKPRPTAKAGKKPIAKTAGEPKARPKPARSAAVAPRATEPKARAVPKKSPVAGTSVDDYVAKLDGAQAEVIRALRQIIREIAPDAKESIKWAQPVFEENGPFAFMKANKNHVTFGFWRGAELADPEGLLEGDGDRMKHVKLAGPGDIRPKVLRAFVRAAVELNRTKGNPTKRS